MPTPHNRAAKGDIADVVLMPGDPLRAQFIVEEYLEGARLVNDVRNMCAFTGSYRGTPVTVMGSGMGVPSMAIYSWELFFEYDVDVIIRTGSAGGIGSGIAIRDLVFAQGACTDSAYPKRFGMPGTMAPIADFGLLRQGVEVAERMGVPHHVGNVVTTDVFYSEPGTNEKWASMGALAIEMETAGLYLNAACAGKRALSILSVSDIPSTGESLTSQERQVTFDQMAEVSLELACLAFRE